jgi:hypothetical protein
MLAAAISNTVTRVHNTDACQLSATSGHLKYVAAQRGN